ncbi:Uncharacterized protein TCM_020041 [Theobroma cacao]|uniref:Uncharacterized protein n=1 Tax=Theobroma cacao TaxID=3641 RepID=A0A061EJP4_THECC|nr:Uncharacterized protein TCM_020041 [Theobroma cacao]
MSMSLNLGTLSNALDSMLWCTKEDTDGSKLRACQKAELARLRSFWQAPSITTDFAILAQILLDNKQIVDFSNLSFISQILTGAVEGANVEEK